jgi:hypothetical protein
LNEGIAIATSTMTGITVHNTSTSVLWVTREGHRIAALVETQYAPAEQRDHQRRDHRDDDQRVPAEPLDVFHHEAGWILEIHLPRKGAVRTVLCRRKTWKYQ